MNDNAWPHRSRVVTAFLRRLSNITALLWPAMNRDLNLLYHWDKLGRPVQAAEPPVQNLP